MSEFEQRIRTLAAGNPTMTLHWAVYKVDQDMRPDGKSVPLRHIPPTNAPREVHAEYAFNHPAVMHEINGDRKINAIKELRGAAGIGLKEAKDAVELAQQWIRDGRPTRDEEEAIERDSEAAIASITETIRKASQ